MYAKKKLNMEEIMAKAKNRKHKEPKEVAFLSHLLKERAGDGAVLEGSKKKVVSIQEKIQQNRAEA